VGSHTPRHDVPASVRSLHGFSHQNVLFGLTIETAENGFRLNMDDSYGISGTIDAKEISIRLTPGKPTDS
jgi:hypothetical protein